MDNTPNYNNSVIVEVSIELTSPQHSPEIMRILFTPNNKEALIDYTGRLVPPGRPQPGQSNQDRKSYYHYKPGKKQISKDDCKSIIGLLKNDMHWYAKKPREVSDAGIEFSLSIKSYLENENEKNLKNVLVKNRYFQNEESSKEFKDIFSAIVKLYNGEKGIFEPAHYD